MEEGTYIPLARPETFNPPSLVNMQIQDEQSDEASPQESSGSESDDEPRRRAKRLKVRPRRPQPPVQPDKKNKYNVWCKALQVYIFLIVFFCLVLICFCIEMTMKLKTIILQSIWIK